MLLVWLNNLGMGGGGTVVVAAAPNRVNLGTMMKVDTQMRSLDSRSL